MASTPNPTPARSSFGVSRVREVTGTQAPSRLRKRWVYLAPAVILRLPWAVFGTFAIGTERILARSAASAPPLTLVSAG